VAQHLAETLTAVEEAYGQLPRIEEMFDAVEQDSGVYGSLLRQVGLSVRRTGEALAAAGIQPLRVNFPPTSEDIAALTLDDPSPQVRLRQQMLAELLVGEGALAELELLRQPTEVRIGPGGVVASARFDPAAAGGTLDEIRELLGHAAITSSQVYLHQPSGIASDGRVCAGRLVSGVPQ
jgi:hypothetical protein